MKITLNLTEQEVETLKVIVNIASKINAAIGETQTTEQLESQAKEATNFMDDDAIKAIVETLSGSKFLYSDEVLDNLMLEAKKNNISFAEKSKIKNRIINGLKETHYDYRLSAQFLKW